jgi:Tfp pilus assembly protein PilF
MIHIINAFLIYLIILHLFGDAKADEEKRRSIRLSAFFTALIWLLTPLNSQAVIYIVQRMTLLVTLFFLLAFYAYLMSKEKNKALYLTLSGVFFALSLFSKQNGVIFPIVVFMYELVFVKKGDIKNITKKEKLFFAALFLILFVTLLLYSTNIYNGVTVGYSMRDFTMYERQLTQFRVLVFYLSLLALPLPGRLSVTHYFVKSTSFISPITTLISFVFLVLLFVLAVVRVKKSPYLSFAIFWFFITISVESTILPLEMAYEHRMYLPCIFLIGALVDFVIKRFYNTRKIPVIAAFLVIAILFGALTAVRGKDWKNETTLWTLAAKKYPNDSRTHYNLGTEYKDTGDLKEAKKNFLLAIKYNAEHFLAHNNLAIIYDMSGDSQRAIEHYKRSLEIDPKFHNAAYNLAALYRDTGNFDESNKYFNVSISIKPGFYQAYLDLASNYSIKKDYEKALELLQTVLDSSPDETEKTKARNAIKIITKIMKLNPAK